MAELIEVETAGGIAVARIRRPPANALEPGLLAAGTEVAARLRERPPAAAVLVGDGDFFSAGIDLKLAPTLGEDEQRKMVGAINGLFGAWYGLPCPVVAAVNGHAVAGGLIWALCADHRVGSLAATYGLTEVRVGAPYPGAALAIVGAELAPGAARRLVLGAELVGARAALELGLVDELAEQEDVLEAALEVGARLAELPAATYAAVKSQLREPVLAAIRAAVEGDPLAGGWLSGEMPGAAAAVLRRRA